MKDLICYLLNTHGMFVIHCSSYEHYEKLFRVLEELKITYPSELGNFTSHKLRELKDRYFKMDFVEEEGVHVTISSNEKYLGVVSRNGQRNPDYKLLDFTSLITSKPKKLKRLQGDI